MCACDATFTCSRCRGSRHAPDYYDEQNDVLCFDPYNAEPDENRPTEYEVTE